MTFSYEVTVPLLKDIEIQAPHAICELRPRGASSTLIVNRNAPPFDNPDLRRAMALTLDRRSFIDVLSGRQVTSAETANWNPKVTRRDYMVGLENTGSAVVDDPDQQLYESYACESDRNFTGYCNRRLEDLFHRQARETDSQRRRELVWDIDRTLQEEGARPVIFIRGRDLLAAPGERLDDDGQ